MTSPLENPNQSPQPAEPAGVPDKGSLLIGFLIGWGAMIGTTVIVGMIVAVMMRISSEFSLIASIAGFLPLASLIALIVWFAQKGKTRTALGIAAAFGSLIVLCLLLVAACFGLMSGTNFGR